MLKRISDDEVIYALRAGNGYFHHATKRLGCSRRALSERIRTSYRVGLAYQEIVKKRQRTGKHTRLEETTRQCGLFDHMEWLSEPWNG